MLRGAGIYRLFRPYLETKKRQNAYLIMKGEKIGGVKSQSIS